MKTFLVVAFLAFVGTQTPASDTGVIEGRVLRVGNSEPISEARVIISRLQPNLPETAEAQEAAAMVALSNQSALERSARGGVSLPRPEFSTADREVEDGLPPGSLTPLFQSAALTDSAGNFRFVGLSAGRYSIQVMRAGYFSPSITDGIPSMFVLTTTTVETGKSAPPINLLMLRGGIINGTIVDPMGQPATNVLVSSYAMTYFGVKLVLTACCASATTNDRGEYRLSGVPPGQYYIGMTPPRQAGSAPRPQDSWAQTFFPGEIDPYKAAVLKATDGAEISGINFSIRTSTASTFRVSGTAINTLPHARTDPRTGMIDRSISEFYLVPHEASLLDGILTPRVQNEIPVNARPNGEFEIRNVKPGSYDLYAAYVDYGIMRYFTDRTTLNVQSDVTGVSLKLNPGVTLSAEIIVDSAASQPIKLDSLKMGPLRPVDATPLNFTSVIQDVSFDAKGKLTLTEVPSGKYLAGVFTLPKSGCVTDVRQDDKSVLDSGFSPRGDSSPVRFLVSGSCSTVSGVVETADHKPASRAQVALVPVDSRRWNIEMYRDVKTDVTGHFSIPGIAPGSYTVYAWESTPQFAWRNAEFISRYEGQGQSVTVVGTAPVDVNLALIPADTNLPPTLR